MTRGSDPRKALLVIIGQHVRMRTVSILFFVIVACGAARVGAAHAAEDLPPAIQTVPTNERAALIALYRATDGANWKERDGWLGPPGTECEWSGVLCDFATTPPTVTGLHLHDNALRGHLPPELDHLTNLDQLVLFGNHLGGTVPPRILEKFDSGRLRFLGYAEYFSSVSAIRLEVSPRGVLCGDYDAIIHLGGAATLKAKFCRSSSPADRATFWETKTGYIDRYASDFDRLARLSEVLHLERLAGRYERSITHASFETITIDRRAASSIVISEYASSAPAQVWLMKRAIAGALFNATWETIERSEPVEE